MGAKGHSIEDCRAFKNLVLLLIEQGVIALEDAKPVIDTNPLPRHDKGKQVNATEKGIGAVEAAK